MPPRPSRRGASSCTSTASRSRRTGRRSSTCSSTDPTPPRPRRRASRVSSAASCWCRTRRPAATPIPRCAATSPSTSPTGSGPCRRPPAESCRSRWSPSRGTGRGPAPSRCATSASISPPSSPGAGQPRATRARGVRARPVVVEYDDRDVNPERFARELPRLFDDYPRSEHPRDRRLAPILAEVGGLARENNLALLNLAGSLLDDGESYVEVGSFKGLSLIAAMLGNRGDFVGIDNFSMGEGSRERVEANLRRYDLAGYTLLEG